MSNNLSDLLRNCGISAKQAKDLEIQLLEQIKSVLLSGNNLHFKGLGTLKSVYTPERNKFVFGRQETLSDRLTIKFELSRNFKYNVLKHKKL